MNETVWTAISIGSLFLGFGLGYFTKAQKQEIIRTAGDIVVEDTNEGKTVYSLVLNCEPEDLRSVNKVIFHIVGDRT